MVLAVALHLLAQFQKAWLTSLYEISVGCKGIGFLDLSGGLNLFESHTLRVYILIETV
jgi:hypothetical protein